MIGLDAFDPDLALGWAKAGELPHLARLLERGAHCAIRNQFGLPGAVWVAFASAVEPVRHRTHSWSEIDVASYDWRVIEPHNELYDAFWTRIAAAGRRVAAIDVPYGKAAGRPHCLELFEWGTHDRHFGLHASPPERAAEIEARFGLHPVFGINAHAEWHYTPDDFIFRKGRYRTVEEEAKLLAALVEGAARKGELLRALHGEAAWDLFIGVFTEAHAGGHQLWHLHDPAHVRFDPARRQRLGDPLLEIYRAIDAQLGRLAEAAGDEALLLVHMSHGMGVQYDGTDLLDELLERLDGHPSGETGAALRVRVKPWLPRLRDAAIRLGIPDRVRFAIARWLRGDQASARARRRFFHEPNNTVYSGIRLNLVGREPLGKVRPEEADRVCAALIDDLMDLVNADSGEPAVKAVHRTDDHHRRAPDDCMPDLLIEWNRTAPIDAVRSTKVGTVRTPYTRIRSGDHRPDGRLLAVGAGIAPGIELPPIRVEDIGPSIAARLGVALDDVDGWAVPWLAGLTEGRVPASMAALAAAGIGAPPGSCAA